MLYIISGALAFCTLLSGTAQAANGDGEVSLLTGVIIVAASMLLLVLFLKTTSNILKRTVHQMHEARKDEKREPVKDKYFAIVLPVVLFLFIFFLLLMVD